MNQKSLRRCSWKITVPGAWLIVLTMTVVALLKIVAITEKIGRDLEAVEQSWSNVNRG